MTAGGRSPVPVLAVAMIAIAAVTAGLRLWIGVGNHTIPALAFLLIVLVVATAAPLWTAIVTSIVAVSCVNFFFMPPVGTFVLEDPLNWVALGVFLIVSVIASNLSSQAREQARNAMARRDELARLFDLSRDILLSTDSREAIAQLARLIVRRFEIEFAAICLPRGGGWEVYDAGSFAVRLDPSQLALALAGANRTLEFDARARTYGGHRPLITDGRVLRIVPLRVGTKAVGLLVAADGAVEAGTLDAIAGVAAIATERAQFLEERKSAELARQSEELKSALLASLGHDLRTPLTAIRVAASNLQASWLREEDRREQGEVILAEVERLNRLFQNILEMARIDTGAVAAQRQWVHPSEIFEAARDQVEHALRSHPVELVTDSDPLVHLDPRLTAAPLAHLLENAAQYTSAGSAITVRMSVSSEGLTIAVRDRGPGIAPADLPRLFERFYRGAEAKRRVSGTGMGLPIARGLLAAQNGRIWAENCADGGAQFTMAVPAAVGAPAAAGAIE